MILRILGDDTDFKSLSSSTIKELIKPYIVKEEDEIVLNCKLVPNYIIDAEEEIYCNEDFEYNVIKYIDQFNSRIKPLLVCFSPDIRPQILITNPNDRKYFTKEQCELVSGFPNKETDQDTYEQLMSLERKELEYWTSINEEPPFVKECGIDWEKIKAEFFEIKKQEESIIFQEENEKYLNILKNLSKDVSFNIL